MLIQNHKAFTMVELVFVIVVIGILSAVAIPRFAVNRDDAVMAKAKSEVASIRSAVSTQRQKLILSGSFAPITSLSKATSTGYDSPIFDGINGDGTRPIFEYGLQSCSNGARGCWYTADNTTYTYKHPVNGTADFNLTNSQFNCDTSDQTCLDLTQ